MKNASQILHAEPTRLPCGGWYAAIHDEILVKRDGCGRIFPTPESALSAAGRHLDHLIAVMVTP